MPAHESQHDTRSIHSGRHTQEAMDEVARKMDRIVQKGKTENWNQSQYHSALRSMLSETRQELRLERNVHETLPIGPQERQSFYIDKQAAKGYKTPPYV